jgi:DNA-binding FrmR family transcriptional regulator
MENNKKKEALRRLKIIKGHLNKVLKMAEEDRYCIDILNQCSAVQSALKGVSGLILSQHLRECVAEAMKKGKGAREKKIKELLKIYQLSDK